MTTKDDKDPRTFDTRVVERNIQKGVITRKDFEKFLKGLPDAKDKVRSGTEAPPSHDDEQDDLS